jgi:hypothetical protein
VIHGAREKRESGTKGTPHEIVSGEDAGGVLGVGVGEVVQDGVEEEEGPDGEEGTSDDGHDPGDAGAGCPAEPEETDGDEETADHGGDQALLGANVAVFVEFRLEAVLEVEEVRGDNGEGADEDAEVGEALGADAEAVDADEDDGEGLEPDVEEAVDEGDVKIEKEDLVRQLLVCDSFEKREREENRLTIGSVKFSVKGRTRLIMTMSLPVISWDINSGWEMSLSLPVSFLRRLARRTRMLFALVSGKKKNNTIKQNPLSHMSSQIGHDQGAVMTSVSGANCTA